MRNTFSLRCVIFTKATITSQSMNTTCTWHKTHIHQTGENLSLLGRCHKFPEFSLIVGVYPKFPEFSLTGKLETHFQGFSLISRVAGNPEQIVQPSSGQLLLDYHARVTSKTIREPHLFQACVFSWVKNQWAAGQDSLSCFQCLV